MIRKIATVLLVFCWTLPVSGQLLKYDVVRNGSSMGLTSVERTIQGNKTIYHLNTKTEFRILFLFEVEYDLVETFDNGVLVSGTSWNTLNDSKQKDTKLHKGTQGYDLTIDGIHTVVHDEAIRESVADIYFKEPEHSKKVFSQYFGRYLTFEQLGDHRYQLVSPDGTNVYTYENGICTEVKISRDFATFSQVLQPELLTAVRNKKLTGTSDD